MTDRKQVYIPEAVFKLLKVEAAMLCRPMGDIVAVAVLRELAESQHGQTRKTAENLIKQLEILALSG